MNHTPGPWKLDTDHPEPGDHYYAVYVGNNIYSDDCQIIAKCPDPCDRCHPDHSQDKEFDANARLIAAAPELLEACKLLHECVEKASKSKYWSFDVAQCFIPARDAADAAITKAEATQ